MDWLAKVRMRLRTSESIASSGAEPPSMTHGCASACSMVSRALTSLVSSCLISSLAGALMLGHGASEKSRWPTMMDSKMAFSLSPQNGGRPHRRM